MFMQHQNLFHGPANSEGSWTSFNNQVNGELARASNVATATVVQSQMYMTQRTIAWQALGQKAVSQILGPRAFAIASTALTIRWARQFYFSVAVVDLSAALASGGARARGAQQAIVRATAAGGYTAATASTRAAAQQATRRQLAKRVAVKIGLKAIPIVGWGLLAYDIYTVTTRGELWGVKLYTEEEVAIP